MPILEITPRERSLLRARAHALRPVVLIGDKGLSPTVLKEIDGALHAHELIKVRAGGQERDVREQTLTAICEALSCAAVHHLGKILILYRPVPRVMVDDTATRAVRRPNAPYVPKKAAAEGHTKPPRRPSAHRSEESESGQGSMAGRKSGYSEASRMAWSSDRTPRPSTHAVPRKKPGAAVKKAGSALSLRAGARRSGGPRPAVKPRSR